MITIVVPTHNEADIIRDTLTRIRSGAGSIPHEIVVSDDGSNDATVATAEGHAEQVVQYAGELPKTIAANRNRGARAAHNDILMFLDSDTRLHDPAHFFDTVIRRFQENPTLVAMTGYARVYPEVETRADRIVLGYLNLQYRVMNLFGLGVTHGKCMIVRASTFREVGGFKEHIVASEDFELFTRLAKKMMGATMSGKPKKMIKESCHEVRKHKISVEMTIKGVCK